LLVHLAIGDRSAPLEYPVESVVFPWSM